MSPEKRFRKAVKSLQDILPENTKRGIQKWQPKFPRFQDVSDVDGNAQALLTSIDDLLNIIDQKRTLDAQQTKTLKDYVEIWYLRSYPFLQYFVLVAQKGSEIVPLSDSASIG